LGIILKLGIRVKSKVVNNPPIGFKIANQFVKSDMALRNEGVFDKARIKRNVLFENACYCFKSLTLKHKYMF